jgi:hypothetical protein
MDAVVKAAKRWSSIPYTVDKQPCECRMLEHSTLATTWVLDSKVGRSIDVDTIKRRVMK